MCAKILSKLVIILISMECLYVWAYNISPKPSLVLRRPNLKTYKPKTRSSYFGYTILLREKSIFIAAPRDQSNLTSQYEIDEPGTIYKCPLDLSRTNTTCEPFMIELQGNIRDAGLQSEFRDNQWLGSAMVGGPKNTDPLLVCAPRFTAGYSNQTKDPPYMHGICYKTTNTMADEPLVHKIKTLNVSKQQYTSKGYHYNFGQQGFSADITKDNAKVLMGAPGIDQWRGSVILYDREANIPRSFQSLQSYSYFGYAVSSGNFESSKTKAIHYVASSIHAAYSDEHDFNSEVTIFDVLKGDHGADDTFDKKYVMHGEQYGDLFGYALLVDDVTNDILDDVIVSAPLHESDGIDAGVVYVYVNIGVEPGEPLFNFRDAKKIVSPFKRQARFGTAMSKLGDINKDGYNDVAIAAPFADGHGAIAIYLGADDGLKDKPSQILGMEPPIEAKMFGHGLSNGLDIDGNGFNDFAVGAPDSELVFVYRTYPIVYVVFEIRPEKHRIEVPKNDITFGFELCYKFTSEGKNLAAISLKADLSVDPFYKRMLFENSNSTHAENIPVNALKDKFECLAFKTIIKYPIDNFFDRMTQHVTFSLVHDAKQYFGEEFCEECVILDSENRKEFSSEVMFEVGCGNKTCEEDLQLTELKVPSNFVLGKSSTLFATYLIKNVGDLAYYMEVKFLSPFPFAKMPSNCYLDSKNGTLLKCRPITTSFSGNMTIELGFDVKNVQSVKAFDIIANASSAGNERTPGDNVLTSTIIFEAHASLEIIGKPIDPFESVYNEKNEREIIYNFEIQNNGPSTMLDMQLNLLMPSTAMDAKNKQIEFINVEGSRASLIRDEIASKAVSFSAQAVQGLTIFEATENNITNEYKNTEIQVLQKNITISLYCNQTNTENSGSCGLAKLTILSLKPAQKITVKLGIMIQPSDIRKLLSEKIDYLESFMDVFIEPSSKKYVTLHMTKFIQPIRFVNFGLEKTPIWIYIAAGVGGLVFLLLMILGLKKLGFFKRQTKEQMEERIHEKLEKERMRTELEQIEFPTEADVFFREECNERERNF